jgi:hypothetical protein
MTDIVVKIMVELLFTLALAAGEMKQGRLGESFLAGGTSLELNVAQRKSERCSQKRARLRRC